MNKSQPYNIKVLRSLYEDLICLKSQINVDSKQTIVKQKIKKYTQTLIWGCKNTHNNDDFFDFFCQTKSIQIYHQIFVKSKFQQITICALQNISKLLINLTKPNHNTYMLSNSVIMNLQTIKFITMSNQLAAYYINFLKTISLKIDQNNIHVFLNKKYPNFPLVWQSIRFYNHHQNLIKTTSRNIILGILKLKEPRLNQYLCRFPFVIYYSHLGCFLRDCLYDLDEQFEKPQKLYLQYKKDQIQLAYHDYKHFMKIYTIRFYIYKIQLEQVILELKIAQQMDL